MSDRRVARAAVLKAVNSSFEVEPVELDDLRQDEVLVAISAVGICHTDTSIRDGLIPFATPGVIGHEGAGTVLKVGESVTQLKAGDRVVLSYNYCGSCRNCSRGRPSYCENFYGLNLMPNRVDGSPTLFWQGAAIAGDFFGQSSFSTHAIAHVRNTIRIEDDVPFEILAPLGCGIQTGAGAVLNSMNCQESGSLVIAGGGTVGLSALMAAKLRKCDPIIVVEPFKQRRELALELGATHVFDPMSGQPASAFVRSIVPLGVDYVLDTTGITATIEALIAVLGAGGICCLVGAFKDGAQAQAKIPLSPLLSKQVITGCIEGDALSSEFIPYLVKMYREGRFPIDRLVRTYPLDSINEAISDQLAGLCVKPVLCPDPRKSKPDRNATVSYRLCRSTWTCRTVTNGIASI